MAKESPHANIVVSPLSIKLLLALIMEGSGGQTSTEILRALQLPLDNRVSASALLQKLQSLILAPVRALSALWRRLIFSLMALVFKNHFTSKNYFYAVGKKFNHRFRIAE